MSVRSARSLPRRSGVPGLLLLLLLFSAVAHSQTGWYAIGSVQASGGQFATATYSRVYTVSTGLRYQAEEYGLTVVLPFVSSNSGLTQSSGSTMPSGMNPSLGSTMSGNGMDLGIGDLNGYFDYRAYSDDESSIAVYVNGQVKAPTSSPNKNIGTGQWDLSGSITVRKTMGDYLGFVDVGYLDIGDPDGITYNNPFSYGVGVGRFFEDGKYSLLLYYGGYSKILDIYDPPQQISLGSNYRLSENVILSMIGSKGIGNSVPDFTFSGGVRIKL